MRTLNNLFKTKIARMVIIAFMAAIICVVSSLPGIPIPLSETPITLQTVAILLAPLLLGLNGAASVALFVAIGALGLPVFAGFKGGFGVLVGPTGGYIIGFIIAALMLGYVVNKTSNRIIIIIATVLANIPIHLIGIIQLKLVLGLPTYWAAFTAGSLPYIPLDLTKTALALLLAEVILGSFSKTKIHS